MVSIARKNLLEDLPRFLVAQAGIMFAVTLVTIQTGLLNGFTRSTVLVIEDSEADLWVASENLEHFEVTQPLVASQLDQTRQIEGVAKAEALLLGSGRWNTVSDRTETLRIIGFNPSGTLFQPGKLTQGSLDALSEPYTVMIDRSRLSALELEELGDTGEIASLPTRLAAVTSESQSIVASPYVYTSLDNANTYANSGFRSELNCQVQPNQDLQCTQVYEKAESSDEEENTPPLRQLSQTDPITYILVKAEPGSDLTALQKRIEEALPETRAYTQEELADITRNYWKTRTGVGWILGLGAIVGVAVGTVVVTQILYASISDHIKEFGTLKAMGASDKYLYGVVLEQALWMAVLGYIPGILLCWGVRVWVASKGIIILITPVTLAGVLGIVVLMCVGSGVLAIQRVTRLDPAIVFKA